MVDWTNFQKRLNSFEPRRFRIRHPCPKFRIVEESLRLGQMPSDLEAMLLHFNGGAFFIDAIPFMTLFGLSLPNDPADTDWFLDIYTPKWRDFIKCRTDWVIGMSNYGGLLVLSANNLMREWDSAQKAWSKSAIPFDEWVEFLIEDGRTYLSNSG